MQDDTVVWQVINHGFCSFKASVAKERTFCQNPYNVSGLCLRSACPLANSQYATIREEDGICYLYMKTAERAHTPAKLWEKTKLPANYAKALEIVSEKLEYFPKYLVHRNKQRLTKIHQMIIRMRKLKLKVKPIIETINTRNEQREKIYERKALQAAQLEKVIEDELLERLRQVASESEIYNYPEREFTKALTKVAKTEEEVEEEYESDEDENEVEYVEDFQESDDDDDDDIEDLDVGGDEAPMSKEDMVALYHDIEAKRNKRKAEKSKSGANKSAKIELEYELEDENGERDRITALATAINSGSSKKSSVDYNF